MSGNHYYEDDAKSIIREALLDTKAQEKAKSFSKGDFDSKPKRDALSQTQLRRFFNDVSLLQKKYETQWREEEQHGAESEDAAKNQVFPRVKPHVKMLKSKVAYSFEKVPSSFERFMNESIDHVDDYRDFEAFLAHFEAVVGFSKPILKK